MAAELNEGDSLRRRDEKATFPKPTSTDPEASFSQASEAEQVRSAVLAERRAAERRAAERLRTSEVGRGEQTDDLITHPAGEEGGSPEGSPTRIGAKTGARVRRSLELENSAAVTLADKGYRIKQNPTLDEVARARQATSDVGGSDKRPDYLIEGRVFDCYSPFAATSVRNIASAVEDKVENLQTQRAVVNLKDWQGDMSALRKQFADWPIEGLKEVKAITPDGDIVQISLPKKTN